MSTMTTQSFSLSFSPEISTEGDVPRNFSGVAYSGGLIPGYGWIGDCAIDLASMQVPTKPVFALLNHDVEERVGKCEVRNTTTAIEVMGSFSQVTEAGQSVAAEFGEGAPWEFSVGLNSEIEQFSKPTEVTINGRTLMVNAVFRNAKVREVSFVPAGADPNTQAVAFEATKIGGFLSEGDHVLTTVELKMSDELNTKLESMNQLNTDLQLKLSAMQTDHAQIVEDLSAKLSAEVEQSKALFDRANELETELKSFKASVRLEAVKALFADLNKDYSEAAGLVYQGMSDESFAAVASDLRSLKPVNLSAALFQETAVKGKENATEISLAAQLFNQVAGVK